MLHTLRCSLWNFLSCCDAAPIPASASRFFKNETTFPYFSEWLTQSLSLHYSATPADSSVYSILFSNKVLNSIFSIEFVGEWVRGKTEHRTLSRKLKSSRVINHVWTNSFLLSWIKYLPRAHLVREHKEKRYFFVIFHLALSQECSDRTFENLFELNLYLTLSCVCNPLWHIESSSAKGNYCGIECARWGNRKNISHLSTHKFTNKPSSMCTNSMALCQLIKVE